MHLIADKPEIAVDFPDKLYVGQFGHPSNFEAAIGTDSVLIRPSRQGDERREVQVHLHHLLFADVLPEIARSMVGRTPIDTLHRDPLIAAVCATYCRRLEQAPPRWPKRKGQAHVRRRHADNEPRARHRDGDRRGGARA